jgi:hypothetical protein
VKTEDHNKYPQLRDMFKCLHEIIVDGLQHGFFDYSITCEMTGKRKRHLVIKAGKSYKFIISDEDLN